MLSFTAAAMLLVITGGKAWPVLAEPLGAFHALVIFVTALSFALFSYVDSIAKDLTSAAEGKDPVKVQRAARALASLKKEVVSNAGLIMAVYALDRIVIGAQALDGIGAPETFDPGACLLLSLRFSLFAVAVVTTVVQFLGFMKAIDYRGIISRVERKL